MQEEEVVNYAQAYDGKTMLLFEMVITRPHCFFSANVAVKSRLSSPEQTGFLFVVRETENSMS